MMNFSVFKLRENVFYAHTDELMIVGEQGKGFCAYSDINQNDLLRLYNMGTARRKKLIKKYNGKYEKNIFYTIQFSRAIDAKNFIDEVLAPNEIAFNLNK